MQGKANDRAGWGRRLFGVVASMWLVVAPLPLPAQLAPRTDGPTVVEIVYEGLEELTEETLNYYLGLKAGEPLDLLELDRAIHRLWDRQLIEDVEIRIDELDDGVRLIVAVEERPILRSVQYDDFKKLGDTEMQDRLALERVRIAEGTPVDYGELERARSILLDMYYEKGYRFADVSYRLEPTEQGDQRVIFTADTGEKVKIEEIDFEGNTVFSDTRLKFMLRKTRESGPISAPLKRNVYNPANFEEDLDRVRGLYREQGYKNVTILDPEIEVRSRNEDDPDAKRRLYMTIPIDEGTRWRFGEITIEGNEVFSDELLLGIFSRPRDEWLKASAIDEGVTAINEIYRNSGYVYARVESELVERDEGVADVVVRIFEGDQYRVGRLEFEGNTRTKDKVLRREFRVQEGMVLNMGGVKNSLFKINQLGYFTLDENNPIEFEDFDQENKTVDLVVHGEESDRTELLFGGGWSELDGFFAQLSLRTQNFLGRGETIGVSIQTGGTRDSFDLSYAIPWFLDRPQSVAFGIFDRSYDYTITAGQRQQREETGGTISYGRSLGLFQSVRLGLSHETIVDRTSVFVGGEDEPVINTNFEYKKTALRPSWLYNSLDSRIEPTRGLRAGASIEWAVDLLGADVQFWRPEVTVGWFRPVTHGFQTVFAVNAGAGWIETIGDEPLPILERYYLGGARSVRGFATRSLFLRDEEGNPVVDPFGRFLGGKSYVQANVEYHFLLGGPFRFILWADAGNVYDPDLDLPIDLGRLRYTAGAELRLFVPMFGLPLRFIYASNLDPLEGDRFESFQFDIGTSF